MLGLRGQDWVTVLYVPLMKHPGWRDKCVMNRWGRSVPDFQSLCVCKTWFYIPEEQHDLLLSCHWALCSAQKHF